ncbi:MAG: hypothetical protein KDD69_04175 [Bdellovibrionales bacterium]|nr:hypothetical protein [Bdellovibrionales bacterium]
MTSTRRAFVLVSALLLGLSISVPQASAQDEFQGSLQSRRTIVSRGGKLPVNYRVAVWRYGNKLIGIYKGIPQDGAQEGTTVLFHDPTFWIVLAENPLEGLPPFIQKVVSSFESRDGLVHAKIDLRISSQETRKRCLAALKSQNPDAYAELVKSSGTSEPTIPPFPVQQIMLGVLDSADEARLGVGESSFMNRGEETIRIDLKFTERSWADFVRKSANGEVCFRPVYLYEGKQVSANVEKTKVSVDLKTKLESLLNSEQIDPSTPLFQSTANKIASELALYVHTERWVEDRNSSFESNPLSEVVALVLDARTATRETLAQKAQERAAVREYLRPLLEAFSDLTGESTTLSFGSAEDDYDVHSDGVIKGKSSTNSTNWNVQAMIPVYGALIGGGVGGGSSSTRQFSQMSKDERIKACKEAMQEIHGVTMVKSSTGNVYRPHKIRLYDVDQDIQEINVNQVAKTFFLEDADGVYFLDSEFLVTEVEPLVMRNAIAKERSLKLERLSLD